MPVLDCNGFHITTLSSFRSTVYTTFSRQEKFGRRDTIGFSCSLHYHQKRLKLKIVGSVNIPFYLEVARAY